jgi:hypothetical protein
MATTLIIFSAIPILWMLSDTFTEFLSGGKSFAPNELKSFK